MESELPMMFINMDSGPPGISWGLVLQVLEAVLEVVCISLPGYIAARAGVFDTMTQKNIANLNMTLFTPCLIFSKLARQLTGERLPELIVVPLILGIMTGVSYISALAFVKIFKVKKKPQSNFITAMAVFGNSNSLPLSLVVSLSHTVPGLHWDKVPGDNDDEVAARGILYLLIFAQLGQALRWSWGDKELLKPMHRYKQEERLGIEPDPTGATPLLPEEEREQEEDANGITTGPGRTDGSADERADVQKSKLQRQLAKWQASSKAKVREWHERLPKPVKTTLHCVRIAAVRLLSIFNPPLTAIFVSLVVALIPPLQSFFFTEGTIFNNSVTYAIEQVGNLAVPITLLTLGANLARNTLPAEDDRDMGTPLEQRKMLWGSLICRMVLPVIVLTPLLALAAKFWNSSILDDPIFVIVCFLLAGAPPALQLSQICVINGVLVKSAAELLTYSYVFWVTPTTMILVILGLAIVKWAA